MTTHMPWPFSDRRFELWIEDYSSRIGGVDSRINRWQSIHGVGNLDDTHGYWCCGRTPTIRAGRC